MVLRPQRLLPLAAALCAAGSVHAQSTPYYIGVSQTFTHESNVYRSQNNEVSDTISSTALFGGVDQMIGRQRVYGTATVSANRFADTSSLNNTGYGLRAGVDWATIERISGSVELNGNQSLARYDNGVSSEKNTLRDWKFSSAVRVGVVTRLTAEAIYTHRTVDYSLAAYEGRNFSQNAVSLGGRYRFSGALSAGVAARFTKGSYEDRATPDDYDRRDIDFTATWTPTGASQVKGRISLSDTSHSAVSTADFSGVTGQIDWDWRPTGKLRFVSSIARDTGEEISLVTSVADQQLVNSRISTSASIKAFYEVSSKVTADAGIRFVRRNLDRSVEANSPIAVDDGRDRTTYASIGLKWTPLRSVTFGCDLGRESRSASGGGTFSYDSNSFGCFGQFALQL